MENKLQQRPLVRKFLGPILERKREPQPFFESKQEAREYMEGRITQRRNEFIAEYKKGFHGTSVLTYEPALDREVYRELRELRRVHEDAYQEALRGLNGYTRFQVETFIGERLNVGLSKYAYDIRDGVLYGQQMNEPLVDMIARGRETREIVGNNVDRARQDAEVSLFEQIQRIMGQAEVGTTILSFSPPGGKGSAYAHNFYDVFVLREKDDGNGGSIKYVEARRYASGLSVDDSISKANDLQPGYKELFSMNVPVDAVLIGNPIVFGKEHQFFGKPDELHKSLQGDEKAMSYDDFQQKIIKDQLFSEMVDHYLTVLRENPTDKKLLGRTLDAIMNRADEIVGLRNAIVPKVSRWRRQTSIGPLSITDHISTYSKEKVRQTSTGCGSSGGLGEERTAVNLSPTRSVEAVSGQDKYGKRTFECPECHELNLREYNQLLGACQHCGSTKVSC